MRQDKAITRKKFCGIQKEHLDKPALSTGTLYVGTAQPHATTQSILLAFVKQRTIAQLTIVDNKPLVWRPE